MTIEEIKEYCIEVDMANIVADQSLVIKDGYKYQTLTNEKEVRLFYHSISLKELLKIFSEYNGLKCYRKEEPEDYSKSYSVDILSIIEELEK